MMQARKLLMLSSAQTVLLLPAGRKLLEEMPVETVDAMRLQNIRGQLQREAHAQSVPPVRPSPEPYETFAGAQAWLDFCRYSMEFL